MVESLPRRRRRAGAAMLAGVLGGCGGDPAGFQIAAAASLRPLLEAMTPAFAAQHAGPCPRIAFGASGQLGLQVRAGAPFALLLAADERTVGLLVGDGKAAAADVFVFARGRLSLWTRDDLGPELARIGLRALAKAFGKIAIADPGQAPYGRAAIEALTAAGILDDVRPRLVVAENTGQAAHFARSGAVAAALLPRAHAEAPELRARGHVWLVPDDQHAPIRHAGVVLAHSGPARAAALAYRDFLCSDAGRALLQANGFEPE